MNTITIPKRELKTAIKESIQEVLTQELTKLRALLLPSIPAKEQKNIEKLYGKPSRKPAKSIAVRI